MSSRVRPGILTFMGVISVIWSSMTMVGVVVGMLLFAFVGLGSWLGGPVTGAVGTLVGLVGIVFLIGSSILSVMLFVAGLRVLRDDPRGISLHRLWAWISLALDAIVLLSSGGIAATSWWGLLYAVGVLYATNLPEVRAYFGYEVFPASVKPAAWDDEAF